jgi:anti-sigma B factor antagonist
MESSLTISNGGDDMERPGVALVVTHANGHPRCAVRGEIDVLTAPIVGQALASLIEIGETVVDLDLSEVEFIDSRGIRELIVAHRAGLRINLVAMSSTVRRTFHVAGIEGFLGE